MAYDEGKLTKLGQLKTMAERLKAKIDAVDDRVDDIVSTGGEPNVITTIQVNGATQTITDKTVNITVPTQVSDLTNDSGFQTSSEVSAAIQAAIAATGHASFQVVESVPETASAQANVLYLVKNSTTGYYDIYALVESEVVLLDDTSVDLTNYLALSGGTMTGTLSMGNNAITLVATPTADTDAANKAYVDSAVATETEARTSAISELTTQITNITSGTTELDAYVKKAGDTMTGALAMGSNKITGLATPTADADAATKAYVDTAISGIEHTTVTEGDADGTVKVNGTDITVVEIATDAEFEEMLDEYFPE